MDAYSLARIIQFPERKLAPTRVIKTNLSTLRSWAIGQDSDASLTLLISQSIAEAEMCLGARRQRAVDSIHRTAKMVDGEDPAFNGIRTGAPPASPTRPGSDPSSFSIPTSAAHPLTTSSAPSASRCFLTPPRPPLA